MPALYAPGSFGTLIGSSGIRHKPTRTGTYRKAMGFRTLCSIFGVSASVANGYITTEGLSSSTDNKKERWVHV